VGGRGRQDVAQGGDVATREEPLDRPLADVARPPRPARELLEPARREIMNARVVRKPRQDVLQAADGGRERGADRRAERDGCDGSCRAHWRTRADASRDAEAYRRRRRGHDDEKRLPARPPVREEELVAARALDRTRRRVELEPRAWTASR